MMGEEKQLMVRFLHSADWQLGMRRYFLDAHAQPRFDQARVEAIVRMAEIARDTQCAFAVVAGDVFESNQVELRTIGHALEALREFPCPVYLLPANHDPFDAGSIYRSTVFLTAKPETVHVLTDGEPVVVNDRSGAPLPIEMVGVPWASKRPGRDLVAPALAKLEPTPDGSSVVRIMVAHGDIGTGFSTGDEHIDLDAVHAALAEQRIHFLALGDRHSTTEIAPRVWYSGAPEATAYREVDSGNALVVEVDAKQCQVRSHAIGRWRFVEHPVTLQDQSDIEALRAWLADVPGKMTTSLKLRFAGALSVEDKANLDALIEEQRSLFAAVEERPAHLSVVAGDLEEWGLSGFLRTGAQELADDESSTARDALALLYRLQDSTPRRGTELEGGAR